VIFVAPNQIDILTDKNIQGTPAMVIEVLSPSTRKRDQRIKLQLYERSGVREYWMVDPDARAVTIHRRADDGSFPLSACLSADANETLRTPLLPEWSLDLSKLFRPLNER
jgi:Uma2 family endonuclease